MVTENTEISNEAFEFNSANLKKAKSIISQYPSNREKSAILPLFDLAQRQNGGWLSTSCIEYVAKLLNIPYIRAYEVATFYTMFNLKPIGKYHIQICGTTPCLLRGSDEIKAICEEEIGIKCGKTSSDNMFTLNEVECLGACVNAPVVQINDDYFEDLTPEIMNNIIKNLKQGKKVNAESQINRQCSAPIK